jgi:ABC-type multidrug transport system fused ATPase/permease subunit
MNVKVKQLSIDSRETSIKVNEQILEVMKSYRESVVRNRREYYLSRISETRHKFANVEAELGFFPNISKYVIDLALVFGALSIAALQFLFTDAKHAVGSILIFLVAGMRIGPAVLRIQQQLIQLKNGSGNAATSLELISEYSPREYLTSPEEQVASPMLPSEFSPALRLENVSFSYPGSNVEAIKNFSLSVMPGQSGAIVGPSGAGKTTLVDLILGIFPPTSGTIQLSNDDPISTFKKFSGNVSYVPQEIFISNGTIRENVALGYPDGMYSDDQIWTALDRAQLSTFVKSLPGLLDSKVGENGSSLSGGQRQRLGIARALFTNPKFLVLDEATSALDSDAEKLVSEAIQSLKGEVTVVLIAHRLSTVRNSDVVVYLNHGEVEAIGTFEEVKSKVPGFNHQADLMGL